jgi:hypothetical protein
VRLRALLALTAVPLLATIHGAPSAFRIEPGAREPLRQLWAASVAAGAERVACLASVVDGDTLRITRIMPLSAGADSMAVSAEASLETCGPPTWQGTVHTHIARDGNGQPFGMFSGSDRGVMLMWWRRWNTDGTFCLVYAEDRAHCEIDGSGVVILPSGRF